jgi:hypothetical protein
MHDDGKLSVFFCNAESGVQMAGCITSLQVDVWAPINPVSVGTGGEVPQPPAHQIPDLESYGLV